MGNYSNKVSTISALLSFTLRIYSTLTQVAVNDLVLLGAFVPTVKLLLQVSNISIPWDTLIYSVLFFVLIPLTAGALLRWVIVRWKGVQFLKDQILHRSKPFTVVALLLVLILIFCFQAGTIIGNPIHILIIAVPFTIQTFFNWALAYSIAFMLKLPFSIAAPASMIAASNFFELAVAVTVSLFGTGSGAVLATTVGVLVEVPIMLSLVFICNSTKRMYSEGIMRTNGFLCCRKGKHEP